MVLGQDKKSNETYLLILLVTLEEGSHPHKTNLVIPHDSVPLLVAGKLERIVEHYDKTT